MFRTLIPFLFCGLTGTAMASEQNGTLSISISGIENTSGHLMIAVYDNESNWLEVPKSTTVTFLEITGKQMNVKLEGSTPLPPTSSRVASKFRGRPSPSPREEF